MYAEQAGYFGMHFIWWIVWVILCLSLFSFHTPVRRSQLKKMRTTPFDILQRRLASGEISELEYGRMKSIISRDRIDVPIF